MFETIRRKPIIDASDNDGDGVPLYVVRSGATVMPTTLGSGSKGVASIDRFKIEKQREFAPPLRRT